ncbi:MAG: L,D-transpeptidase [Leptolyngbyaceae bacterium]|nr:L,D-transpeptidase [Leptolyngbyaceae bacterium]
MLNPRIAPSLFIKRLRTVAFFIGGGVIAYYVLMRAGFVMPMSEIPAVLCLEDGCEREPRLHPEMDSGTQPLLNAQQSIHDVLDVSSASNQVSILIEKSQYRLTVFNNLRPIKSYPVVFGSSPAGDKLREGDRKTPEGIYRIRDLYPHPQWSKFIWLDYPTPQSWRNHLGAKMSGQLNPLFPIGGQIGIHGVPAGNDDLIDQRSNWTWGCISLKNKDVDELYEVVSHGTIVEIVP